MQWDFILLDNYMLYNNSFNFILKVLGKDFPIKILQTSKHIECHYNCIEYSSKNKYIDTNLKLAMKHFLIQAQVDYLDSICNKKNITSQDLGFFTNMFVLRGLTSSPSIDLLNIDTNKYEKIKTTFFSDKMVCGALGNQYLSPITTFLFKEEWVNLTQTHKYEKILDYDKNFNLKILNDMNFLAEAIWDEKFVSGEYNSFENFLVYFKELVQQQYWIHNYDDFKFYKSLNDYVLYPDIYQILYNLNFEFDDSTKINKIYFDALFFEKNLIETIDLSQHKSIEDFKTQINDWRDKGQILEFKKSFICLSFINEKYILDDYVKTDLNDSFDYVLKNSKENNITCFLFLLESNSVSFQKLKFVLKLKKIPFFYYIPSFETKSFKNDLLLIGVNNNQIDDFNFFFLKYNYYFDFFEIKNCLLEEICWEKTDLYNHYLCWQDDNQQVVSSFLDFVCGGLVSLLPKTWNS